MPEQVHKTVVVNDVRNGDVMPTGEQAKIVDVKQKYVFITMDSGMRRKFIKGTQVEVRRMVPTDAERTEREVERFVEKVEWYSTMYADQLRKAISNLAERMMANSEDGHTHPMNFDKAADIAMLQEKMWVWRLVAARRESFYASLVEEQGLELDQAEIPLRAVRATIMEARSYLLSSTHHRSLSRSTSVTSNLVDDMKKEAMAEFLDTWRYMDMAKMFEHVTGEKFAMERDEF